MRGIVHQALAVDHPLVRVRHMRDTTGPAGLVLATVWLSPPVAAAPTASRRPAC
jgi:hypothetical protein